MASVKRRIMLFDPCIFQLLVDKGTVMSIVKPGLDLGPDYLEHLHYVFAFDREETVHAVTDRCSVHSFNKGQGILDYVCCAIRVVRRCIRLVREERIDLVFSVDPYVGSVLAWMVARITGIPYLVGIQGEYDVIYRETGRLINPALKFRWLENLICRFSVSMADMVIVYVDAYRHYAQSHGGDPSRTVLVRVGCPEHNFVPAAERGVPAKNWRSKPGDKLIAYTGRIDKRKYADHLLKIYLRVCQKRSDVTCLMIGDGPDRGWIEDEIRKSDYANRIIVTGFIPNEEVWKVLPTLDIYVAVLAGLSLIEAGAAGCAIVAYDTDWHPEFILHDKTGVLVPFHDTDRYADEILSLLDDDVRRQRLGAAATRHAFERHSAELIKKTFIYFYEMAIRRERPPYPVYRADPAAR